MKLKDYADKHEVSYRTAWNRYKKGLIPNAYKDELGFIRIKEDITFEDKKAVLYARVSSSENKGNLKSQIERLESYAISKGFQIIQKVEEIGSGMNDERPKLIQILSNSNYNILLVEHKDRLTRFGFNYIQTLLNQKNIKIEVINLAENAEKDLMQDLISIIYSFSARLYGKRRKRNKLEQILKNIETMDRE